MQIGRNVFYLNVMINLLFFVCFDRFGFLTVVQNGAVRKSCETNDEVAAEVVVVVEVVEEVEPMITPSPLHLPPQPQLVHC